MAVVRQLVADERQQQRIADRIGEALYEVARTDFRLARMLAWQIEHGFASVNAELDVGASDLDLKYRVSVLLSDGSFTLLRLPWSEFGLTAHQARIEAANVREVSGG
jgi:hypothetical protein